MMTTINKNEQTTKAVCEALASVYGNHKFEGLTDDIFKQIERHSKRDAGTIENRVMQTIWMWYPGGGTAAHAAKKVMAALNG